MRPQRTRTRCAVAAAQYLLVRVEGVAARLCGPVPRGGPAPDRQLARRRPRGEKAAANAERRRRPRRLQAAVGRDVLHLLLNQLPQHEQVRVARIGIGAPPLLCAQVLERVADAKVRHGPACATRAPGAVRRPGRTDWVTAEDSE